MARNWIAIGGGGVSGGGGGAGGGLTTLTVVSGAAIPNCFYRFNQVTATANLSISAPVNGTGSPSASDEFVLCVTHDALGPWTVTFDPVFIMAAYNGLQGAPSTHSTFRFWFDGANWKLVNPPLFDVA